MEPKSGGLEDDFLFERVEFLPGGSVSFRDPTLNHRFHATAAETPLASPKCKFQKWQIIATQNLQLACFQKLANGILGYDMFSVFCCPLFGSFVVPIEGKNLEFALFFAANRDIESQNWVQNGATVTMVFPCWSWGLRLMVNRRFFSRVSFWIFLRKCQVLRPFGGKCLVGGWTNPSDKYDLIKFDHLPKQTGWK